MNTNTNGSVPVGQPVRLEVGAADVRLPDIDGADSVSVTSESGLQAVLSDEPGGAPMIVVPAGGSSLAAAAGPLYIRSPFGRGFFTVQGYAEGSSSVPIQSNLKPVAHNTGNNVNNQFGHITGQTSVLTRALWCFPSGAAAIQPLWLGFELPNTESEIPIPNPMTIQAALELPDGHLINLTFNGQPSAVLQPDALLSSDPRTVDIPAGTWCWLRTWIQVSSGGSVPYTHSLMGLTDTGLHEGYKFGAASVADTVPDSFGYSFDAVSIFGIPRDTQKSGVAVIGDSISAYVCDVGYQKGQYAGMAAGCQGWANRFCFEKYGLLNLSRSGYGIQHYSDDSGLMRKEVIASAGAVIFALGINDLISGRSLAQLQADMQDSWLHAKALGMKVIQATLIPCTQSGAAQTMAFITGTGSIQSPSSWESVRQSLNEWIRSRPQFLDDVLDLDSVIDPQKTGYWPMASPVYSGTCASGSQSPGLASLVASDSPGWTAGQWAKPADGWGPYIVIMTSGAAAGKSGAIIDNDANTLTVGGTSKSSYPVFTGIAAGDSFMIVDAASYEGLHPFPRMQAKLAAFAATSLQPILGK